MLAVAARVSPLVSSYGYRGFLRIMVGLIPEGGSTRPAIRAIRVIRGKHRGCAGITREPRPRAGRAARSPRQQPSAHQSQSLREQQPLALTQLCLFGKIAK
jgi:hypothetical protein